MWTEGGQGIGMGHLSRSLAIAREFNKFGHSSLFLINDDPHAEAVVNGYGFPFQIASLKGKELPSVAAGAPKILVFDTQKDISLLIEALKPFRHKTVLLDNTRPARLTADVVIYPSALFDHNLSWPGFTGRIYSGAEYAPVDESYLGARDECQRLKYQPPYHILVTMGGSDPKQLTYQVVASLRQLTEPIDIRVIIGPAFMPDTRLSDLEGGNDPRLQFISNPNSLSSLMADSHLAITAMGITLYELAAVGVPGIIITNYAEDERDMQLLKELGMNLPLGFCQDVTSFQIQSAVSMLLQDATAWKGMRNRGWQIVDGQGAKRIVECILRSN